MYSKSNLVLLGLKTIQTATLLIGEKPSLENRALHKLNLACSFSLKPSVGSIMNCGIGSTGHPTVKKQTQIN